VILLCPPGVYRAQSDTQLLAGHFDRHVKGRHVPPPPRGARPAASRRRGSDGAAPPAPGAPGPGGGPPRHTAARSWDGGPDGRAVLDRICDGAAAHLEPDGVLLLVHSQVCGPQATVDRLAAADMTAEVVDSARIPFGPVMRSRAGLLERRGLIAAGDRLEELVVVEAHRA